MSANPVRGDTSIALAGVLWQFRPSYGALVGAEAELGPLFALVERAAQGNLALADCARLLWHCRIDAPHDDFESFADALIDTGLAQALPATRQLLTQILAGR